MNSIMEINTNGTLKQSNRLVVARYKLTKYEQRMMIAVCSQLKKNANEFETIKLQIKDLAEFCKFKGEDEYRKVHSVMLKLMSRTLQIQKDNGKWYITHWLQSADYLDNGTIEFQIDQRLKPELLQLKSAYLETKTAPLMEFKSDYSTRLYFILSKMTKIKEFDYELSFFVDRFQLGETYLKISNLKNRVLEPAIAEINEKSDIKIEHQYLKVGRTIKKIHFIVTLKKDKDKSPEELEQVKLLESTKSAMDEDQKAVLKNLVDRGVSAEQAKRIVKRYSVARMRRNIALAVKQKDTAKNLPGLIIKFIKEDIAGQNEKAKIELEKEKKTKAKDRKQARELFHGQPAETLTDSKGNVLQYDEPVKVKI